jgi:hypothetical protein
MKIAIFISGPKRYTPLVVSRLRALHKTAEISFLIHLWSHETGVKARTDYVFGVDELLQSCDIKALICHMPYDAKIYEDTVGIVTNSGSPINATMGMFMGVNQLCKLLQTMPDYNTYTHILRLRTDCAILADDFFTRLERIEKNTVVSGDNPLITTAWVSDHIYFTTKEQFLAVWCFDHMSDIYKRYSSARRNPERMLTILSRDKLPGAKMVPMFKRYIDYQIVYSNEREGEPLWANNLIKNGGGANIFQYKLDREALLQSEIKFMQKRINYDPYGGYRYFLFKHKNTPFIGKILRIIKKLVAH